MTKTKRNTKIFNLNIKTNIRLFAIPIFLLNPIYVFNLVNDSFTKKEIDKNVSNLFATISKGNTSNISYSLPTTEWNIFTHNYVDGNNYYENFDPNYYSKRNGHGYRILSDSDFCSDNDFEIHSFGYNEQGEELLYKNGYTPQQFICCSSQENSMDRNIIGTDDRIAVSNPHISPYCKTGFIEAIFYDVPVVGQNRTVDVISEGTGFIMGTNLVATAAHVVYLDPSSSTIVDHNGNVYTMDDRTVNYRIADDINFYPGCSYYGDTWCTEINPIEISIHKNYFESQNVNYDWATMMADTNVGVTYGWHNGLFNWYEYNYNTYTYGYPYDKNYSMWESPGKITGKTNYELISNLDVVNGNSGGAYFVDYDNWTSSPVTYAVGIITRGNSTATYGTKFTSFVGQFMNSFMYNHWPSC